MLPSEHYRQPEAGAVLTALHEITARCGYLPEDEVRKAATELGVPLAQMFSAATFYAASVERYFQTGLFYGLYPSMGGDASNATAFYWSQPDLYNRDRPLFRRYVPLIRRLNASGWQPVTRAKTSNPAIYIERFGDWPQLYFTLRNTQDVTATVSITVEADALGLPASPVAVLALLANENHSLDGSGASRTLTVTLGPQASEALYLDVIRLFAGGDRFAQAIVKA